MFAWGSGNIGRLGDGTTTSKSSPVQIGSSSWSVVLASGGAVSLAIRSDNILFAWGRGATYGSQGVGDRIARSSPAQVGGVPGNFDVSSPIQVGSSSWTAVSAGTYHVVAIDSNYKLFTWGRNTGGQLGDGTTTDRSSPVQIGSSSWTAVSAGLSHTVAIRSDGGLFAWGAGPDGSFNSRGQLGDGILFSSRSSPIQIGTNSWTIVSSGGRHTAGISNNLLYTWGDGTGGQRGDGATTSQIASPSLVGNNNVAADNRSSPVQVGTSSWTAVSCGRDHAGAITSNSKLYAWGTNTYGQLGQNNIVSSLTPVQVGTRSWTLFSAGDRRSIAV